MYSRFITAITLSYLFQTPRCTDPKKCGLPWFANIEGWKNWPGYDGHDERGRPLPAPKVWGLLGFCEYDPNKGGMIFKYLVFDDDEDKKGLKEALKSLGNEFGNNVYYRKWKRTTVCDSSPKERMPFGEVYNVPLPATISPCKWGQGRSAVTKLHTKNKAPARHETLVKARKDESNERLRGTYLFLFVYTNYFKTYKFSVNCLFN